MLPLEALAARHEIVAVVRPWPKRSPVRRAAGALARRIGLRERVPLEEWARARRLPCLTMSSGDDAEAVARLAAVAPDLICISTFRWILSAKVLAIPPRGVINLHPSLLPRHRGPMPLFWIYHRNDHESGVTVHRASERADAGEILAQDRFPLPRGFPVELLDAENARRGAAILTDAVEAIADGSDEGRPQDEALATPAPAIRPGTARIDFETWNVERVWHFMAGLFPRYREPLKDDAGKPLAWFGVIGFEEHDRPARPGSVSRDGEEWRLHCRGGDVRLDGGGPGYTPGNGRPRTRG